MPTKTLQGVYDTSKFYLARVVNLGDEFSNSDLPDLPVKFNYNKLKDWARLDERNLSSCI